MDEPRIPTGTFRELGPANWVAWRVISRVMGVPDAHLFSTLARTGRLFRAWLLYSANLMPCGKLTRFEVETAILRVAHLREADYELDHHTRIGKRAGIGTELRNAIFDGPESPLLSERQRAIVAGVDDIVRLRDITDAAWHKLAEHFDERRMVEFTMLVTQYDALATTLKALRVQRDYA